MDNYLFQAAPKPVQTRTKKPMYRSEEESKEATLKNNLMFDRRVARGSTYAPSRRTQPLLPNQTFRPLAPAPQHAQYGSSPMRREAAGGSAKQQHPLTPAAAGGVGPPPFGSTAASDSVDFIRIATPEPVAGRVHTTVQTDTYLEDLRRPRGGLGHEFATQTDAEHDHPTPALFVPRSSGDDIATEIEPDALFDFELEVQAVLGVLVEKSLEQALMEVCEEEEEAALLAHQAAHQQRRNNHLANVQQLVQRDERRQQERDRRAAQEALRLQTEAAHAARRQAALLAKQLVQRMQEDILSKLDRAGAFYDPVRREVETIFMPALMAATAERLAEHKLACDLLDSILGQAIGEYRSAAAAAGVQADEEMVSRLVAHALNPAENPRPVEGVLSLAKKACLEDERTAWTATQVSAAEAAAAAAKPGRQGPAALSPQQRADAIVAGILAERAAAAAAEAKRAADIIRIQALQRGKRDRARAEKLAAKRRLEAERAAMSPQELLVSLENHLGFQVALLPPAADSSSSSSGEQAEEVWVVSAMEPAGPASQAGLVLGDQIVAYAGVPLSSESVAPLRNPALLKSPPFALNPGDSLALSLVRRGTDRRREEVLVELACGEEGFRDQQVIRQMREDAELPGAATPWLDGASALEALQRMPPGKLGATMAEQRGGGGGARLAKVSAESAAARAGLAEGDVIVSLNGAPISDGKAFAHALKDCLAGEVLDLELLTPAALAKLAANDGASARSVAALPTVKRKVELAGGGKKAISVESLRSLRRIAGLPVFGEQ